MLSIISALVSRFTASAHVSAWRRISVVTGIREPGHDRFGFHITLGYQFAALSMQEAEAFRMTLARWKSDIAARAPIIPLGAPEFYLLADMFAFKRQFYLQ